MPLEIQGPFEDEPSSFRTLLQSAREEALNTTRTVVDVWNRQPWWSKIIAVILACCGSVAGVLFLIYHKYLLHKVAEYSEIWAEIPWLPFALMGALFIISFPPVIGFSFVNTVVGAVYGITLKGWLIIVVGSISGSVAAFVLFRYVLKARAKAIINGNKKLLALSSVLQDNNSFWLLALIRVCPFPYSLCNGALAAIPGVTLLNYFLGSFISSPKLVMYLFVGQKLKDIGQTTNTWSIVLDVLSIVLTVSVLTLTGWLLFTKTANRIKELEYSAIGRTEDELERQVGYDDVDDTDVLSLHTQPEIHDSDDSYDI